MKTRLLLKQWRPTITGRKMLKLKQVRLVKAPQRAWTAKQWLAWTKPQLRKLNLPGNKLNRTMMYTTVITGLDWDYECITGSMKRLLDVCFLSGGYSRELELGIAGSDIWVWSESFTPLLVGVGRLNEVFLRSVPPNTKVFLRGFWLISLQNRRYFFAFLRRARAAAECELRLPCACPRSPEDRKKKRLFCRLFDYTRRQIIVRATEMEKENWA